MEKINILKIISLLIILVFGINNVFSITEYSKVDLIVDEITPNPVQPGQDLTVKYPNIGIFGLKKVYIGKIEKEDYVPAIFSLSAQKNENYKAELKVYYSEDLEEHIKTQKLILKKNEI
jgi:hypothetical protein